MALTGLVLIAFLCLHMFGNLKIFIGPEAYNHYAEWLKMDILYPFLPKGWFIWIFRAVIAACLVIHVYCAATLWATSIHARGTKYVKKKTRDQTLSSKIMRWGGLTLLVLLIFHILMFTTGSITPGFTYALHDPYSMFMGAFSQWWVFVIYLIFMIVVCFHVRHGFWSAFTTLGANVGSTARLVLNVLAYLFAALIFVGFILPPFAVLIGLVN